jgi:hypothetical protein
MPPPAPLEPRPSFSEMVLLSTVVVPKFIMPPPPEKATLPLMELLSAETAAELQAKTRTRTGGSMRHKVGDVNHRQHTATSAKVELLIHTAPQTLGDVMDHSR